MSEKRTENSEFRPEREERMNARAEASGLLQEIAGPGPVKVAISRAEKAVSKVLKGWGLQPMGYGRAEDIWRQEARRIDAEEMDAIRAAATERRRLAAERTAGDELAELRGRIALLEHRLETIDPDFHRESIDVAGQMARDLGGGARRPHRAVD